MAGKKETRKLINQDGNNSQNGHYNSLIPTPKDNVT